MIPELSEVFADAVAKQMDWDLGEELMQAQADGGNEEVADALKRRSDVSPEAILLLRPVLYLDKAQHLPAFG